MCRKPGKGSPSDKGETRKDKNETWKDKSERCESIQTATLTFILPCFFWGSIRPLPSCDANGAWAFPPPRALLALRLPVLGR